LDSSTAIDMHSLFYPIEGQLKQGRYTGNGYHEIKWLSNGQTALFILHLIYTPWFLESTDYSSVVNKLPKSTKKCVARTPY
jgi:hypothetical protein